MQKNHLKAAALPLAMVALMLLPLTMNAQYKEHQFGLQEWGQTSLLGRQDGGNRSSGSSENYDLHNQQFGSGYDLYNQTFGQQSAPVGSGLLILAAAGAGYALRKRKNNSKK